MGKGRNVIQKRYLDAGGLGHDGVGTADVQTVAVYMHEPVGRARWLRTKEHWLAGQEVVFDRQSCGQGITECGF